MKKYENIPDGNYEVWVYFYMFGHAIPFGRSDRLVNVMIVFDEWGVVYKKFYSDQTDTEFVGSGSRPVNPSYEELK